MQPFESLVNEHGDVVHRVCRALLPANDADDAWSETFLAALRAYPPADTTGNIRGWLVTIAHRKAIDQLRARAHRPVPVAELPERHLTARDVSTLDAEELRRALIALPAKQRHAVVYRYIGDLTYDDIATMLSCSPSAARRNVADGLQSLRRVYSRSTEPDSRRGARP